MTKTRNVTEVRKIKLVSSLIFMTIIITFTIAVVIVLVIVSVDDNDDDDDGICCTWH